METQGGRRDEVRVLAEAFNHMLGRLADAFASQREFVADASHELRTPLTVIRGQLEVLARKSIRPAAKCDRVERLVQAEITRISRLVDDLVVLAQAEQTDFCAREEIDLRPFITDLWDGVSLTAERRYELGENPMERCTPTLTGSPRRCAISLATRSSTLPSTTVSFGSRSLARRRPDLLLDARRRTGHSAAERERVFERFHRTDTRRARSAGGAGLGLAIVRAIADRPRRRGPRGRSRQWRRRADRARAAQVRVGPDPDRSGDQVTAPCALPGGGPELHSAILVDGEPFQSEVLL